MIYDTFIFFDELDLLEIRLHELSDVVDFFVLVESTETFSGKKKELCYQKNKGRFKAFRDRIIHVIVDDMPVTENRWQREIYQRNAIMRGLEDCDQGDTILISDVDEIPSPEGVVRNMSGGAKVFKQRLYYYYLNCQAEVSWNGTVMIGYKHISTPQDIRDLREALPEIDCGGWHFSYLGGVKKIIEKIESFSHAEVDNSYYKDITRLQEKIERGKDPFDRGYTYRFVGFDKVYPCYLLKNLAKFRHLIKESDGDSGKMPVARNRGLSGNDKCALSPGFDDEKIEPGSIFTGNMEALKEVDPELVLLLKEAIGTGDCRVFDARNGEKTLRVVGLTLHSLYRPSEEAGVWAAHYRDAVDGSQVLCVFGFAFGYHIERLCRMTESEIVVFEPRLDVLKEAFRHRDLREVIGRVRFITGGNLPVVKEGFDILEHTPSVRLSPEYFERVRDRLNVIKKIRRGLRIAVVGPIYGGSLPVTEYCVKALRRLGHRVDYIDNSAYRDIFHSINAITSKGVHQGALRTAFVRFASEAVLARCDEWKPDLLFALAQAPLEAEGIERLRGTGLKTAFWFVEDFRCMEYWRGAAQSYDYFFTIQKEEILRELSGRKGQGVHYLPMAASPDVHRGMDLTEEDIGEYGSDISFVGAGYRNRRKFFEGLLDFDFRIWGNEWDTGGPVGALLQRDGERIGTEETVRIFNATKININLHSSAYHDGVNPYGDFVNPRTFEIAACGRFQLVDYRRYIPEMFKIGEEIVCFNGLDDLRKKVGHYLDNPAEREEIAKRASDRVRKEHTYEHRMEEMMDFIVETGFEPPLRRSGREDVRELVEKAGKDSELGRYLMRLADRAEVSIEDIVEGIHEGEGDLSRVEKLFILMNQMKNQYLVKQ
ncbi:spore protein YkvP [bacterium BMS3Abin08]|nr:spore protein YkvP [bacterium BMS3Abin08]